MNEKTYFRLLLSLIAIGLVGTVAHFLWAADAYQSCSIIEFIARELW